MKHKDAHRREGEASPETSPQGKGPRRGTGRPSMRHEFLELFRDTSLRPPDDASATRPAGQEEARGHEPRSVRAAGPAEPSRFLRRFLQQAAPVAEVAPSGLPSLDERLGGGFGYGLHLVIGARGSGKTAFLESLAWEAVGSRRPSLYYALKPGSLEVWGRLIATLGAILGGPGITPAALRGRDLMPEDIETLARLDAALQAWVLPYLSLIDAAPGSAGNLSAFIEGVRSHSQEAAQQHGRLPLVLVDDLDELVALTGSRSPLHVLSRLDAALAADSMPGLLAAGADGALPGAVDRLPARTVVALAPVSAEPGRLLKNDATPPECAGRASGKDAGSGRRVDLEVMKDSVTGWKGTLPLLLDPVSGLFAEAAPD